MAESLSTSYSSAICRGGDDYSSFSPTKTLPVYHEDSGMSIMKLTEGTMLIWVKTWSPTSNVASWAIIILQDWHSKPILFLYTDGACGPDHRLTYFSVQLSLISKARPRLPVCLSYWIVNSKFGVPVNRENKARKTWNLPFPSVTI